MAALIEDYHQHGAWFMAMTFLKLGKMRASGKITREDIATIANDLESANKSPFIKG